MKTIINARKSERILAIFQLIDSENNLIGFTIDLTLEGIRLIVSNQFTNDREFTVILKGNDLDSELDILLTVEKRWRQPKDEYFDEIGGLLIEINPKIGLEKLLNQFSS